MKPGDLVQIRQQDSRVISYPMFENIGTYIPGPIVGNFTSIQLGIILGIEERLNPMFLIITDVGIVGLVSHWAKIEVVG
jgi:hypothetical protein